ncbi:peptidase associated/transthyretin-like domain-containing protein [Geomesophilobacter sediminis]|uniref:Carboxypeptidase regulatory-like domain-containing protein n=1 Tax=Geomesophilobacter sediminis TaxID=2798584 RepID=A0A8J7JK17_9BACT|nr:hypothetical protein [Geomesophilobacter sediminis]MBJ6723485.1 hypothetical protein [Geomesophilobacter sediminis]
MVKIAGLLTLALLLCTSALGAEIAGFKAYFFDGQSFREGKGEGGVLVKDYRLPVPVGEGAVREDPLPANTGAVALLCYLQSGGGKLKRQPRVIPIAGVAVQLQGGSISLAARTDVAGYLILALPPGNYTIRLGSFEKAVVIERGKTTLASLRGGKRMVD